MVLHMYKSNKTASSVLFMEERQMIYKLRSNGLRRAVRQAFRKNILPPSLRPWRWRQEVPMKRLYPAHNSEEQDMNLHYRVNFIFQSDQYIRFISNVDWCHQYDYLCGIFGVKMQYWACLLLLKAGKLFLKMTELLLLFDLRVFPMVKWSFHPVMERVHGV